MMMMISKMRRNKTLKSSEHWHFFHQTFVNEKQQQVVPYNKAEVHILIHVTRIINPVCYKSLHIVCSVLNRRVLDIFNG